MRLRTIYFILGSSILIFMFNNCSEFKTMTDINPSGKQTIQSSNQGGQMTVPAPLPAQQVQPSPNPLPTPVVSGSSIWANEPANFKVVSDWGFDSLNGGGWHDEGGAVSIVSDPTAPISKSNVLQQKFFDGMVAGVSPGNNWTVFQPSREVYLGFYWKANPGFQQNPANITKIIFLSDTGGNPFFFYMGGAPGSETYTIGMQQQGGICNDHLSGFPGICGTWDMGSEERFKPGEWVKIELYVKMSTSESSKDGTLRYWVNGKLGREFTTMNFGQNLLTSVPIVPIWGGVGGVKSGDDYFWYDHIHISIPK